MFMADTEEIKSKLDVVDIISETVQLKKSGRNYKANCPFHDEKTPSFIVDPVRQTWHCFGQCSTGGDVFSFVMKSEKVEFIEALRSLALKAGVDVSFQDQSSSKKPLYDINDIALKFFQESLLIDEAQNARDYLELRGIKDQSINTFSLGYSPKSIDALKIHLAFHEIDFDQALKCGLLTMTENGRVRDFFGGRLMFPIHDNKGRVCGFGARTLDGSPPKYINTPATGIFDKQSLIYGIHLANDAIKSSNKGVIVEGYMDVIAAHEYGYENVVASMGTALTVNQVTQLKRLAGSFVLALDQDDAGQEATLRSLESSWRVFDGRDSRMDSVFPDSPVELKVLSLPSGKDPDEFIRNSDGMDDWGTVIDSATPIFDYLTSVVFERYNVNLPGGKNKIITVLAPVLNSMDILDKEHYLNEISKELGLDVDLIRTTVNKMPKNAINPPKLRIVKNTIKNKDNILDEKFLALLLKNPNLRQIPIELDYRCFNNEEDRELYRMWIDSNMDSHEELAMSLDGFLKDRYHQIIMYDFPKMTNSELDQNLDAYVRQLKRRFLKQLRAAVTDSVEDPTVINQEDQKVVTDLDKQIIETYKY